MSKFSKRIIKYVGDNNSALVIGNAFGNLIEVLDIFKTVFIISNTNRLKFKNAVYREGFETILDIGTVSVILVDLDKIKDLELMPSYWTKCKPLVLIEGNEPIDRTKSIQLYRYGYQCVDQLGFCHVWKKI